MRKLNAFLLAGAMAATLSSMAVAQNDRHYEDNYRYHRDSDDYRFGRNSNNDAREYGFRNGYRDGYNRGRYAGNDRYRNNQGWRGQINDTRGYERSMGAQGQYKKGYREGYRDGYQDAYNGRRPDYGYVYGQGGHRERWDPDGDGRPGWNNNQGGHNTGGYNNGGYRTNGNAQRFGYQDGLQAGQRDRTGRHSYRPTQWEAYKDADHGRSSSTGYRNSDEYKREYRQAFLRGYDQGFGRR